MESKKLSSRKTSTPVEALPGIFRTTLAYNKETMLCHFQLKQGSAIPLHDHVAVQIGYVISGSVKFQKGDGSSFIAESGTGYVFDSEEQHGAEALEDSEVIECFAPMRPEYADWRWDGNLFAHEIHEKPEKQKIEHEWAGHETRPELNDLDAIYARAKERKVPLIRMSVSKEELLTGRVLERFPTGVTLKHDAASIQDAVRIMSAYRE